MEQPNNFLSNEENKNLEGVQRNKETVYSREESRNERKKFYLTIDDIDGVLEEYSKGVFSLKQTLDILIDMSSHKEVKPNVQVYSFEQLLKLAGESTKNGSIDNEGAEEIIRSALITINDSSNNTQKIYFMSLLHHFTSNNNLQEIEKNIQNKTISHNDEDSKKYVKAVSILRSAAIRLHNNGEFRFEGYEMEEKMLQEIINEFSIDGVKPGSFEYDENETVRLLSVLYAKNPEKLRKNLEIEKEEIIDTEGSNEGTHGSGEPWMVVNLPEGRIPTRKKIEEAKLNNMYLGFNLSREVSSNGKEIRHYLDFPLSERLSELYYSRMRHYRDLKPKTEEMVRKFNKIESTLRQRIWNELIETDPDAAEEIGSIDNLIIRMKTVRDYPEGDTDDPIGIEEIFTEEEKLAA